MKCSKSTSSSDTDTIERHYSSGLLGNQNQILRNVTKVSILFCMVILIVISSRISVLKFSSFSLLSVKARNSSLQSITPTSSFLTNLIQQMSEPHTLVLGQTLNAYNSTLRSPNKRYILTLKPTGDLQMSRLSIAIATGSLIYNRLWWTSTDDHYPNSTYEVRLNPNGVLELMNFNPYPSWPKAGVAVWKSTMYTRCHQQTASPVINPKLALLDEGRLLITSANGVLCELFSEVWSPFQKPQGRLAVIIAGFLRTNEETCASHRALFNNWNGQVDVYVGTYLQEVRFGNKSITINNESIQAHLNSCYGKLLKDYLIRDVNQVIESFVFDSKRSHRFRFSEYGTAQSFTQSTEKYL